MLVWIRLAIKYVLWGVQRYNGYTHTHTLFREYKGIMILQMMKLGGPLQQLKGLLMGRKTRIYYL